MKKLALLALVALGISCSSIYKPMANSAASAVIHSAPAAQVSAVPSPEQLMSLLRGDPDPVPLDVKCPETGHCVLYQRLDGPIEENHLAPIMGTLKAAQAGQIVMLDINTPGGSVADGFELEKALESTSAEVFCVVDGDAYSMGFFILQSCQHRVMTKRSNLMAHEPLEAAPGGATLTISTLENITADLVASARALAEQGIARTTLTYEEYLAKTRGKNWFMAWPEAQSIKAVDCVYAGTGSSARKELGERGELTCQR